MTLYTRMVHLYPGCIRGSLNDLIVGDMAAPGHRCRFIILSRLSGVGKNQDQHCTCRIRISLPCRPQFHYGRHQRLLPAHVICSESGKQRHHYVCSRSEYDLVLAAASPPLPGIVMNEIGSDHVESRAAGDDRDLWRAESYEEPVPSPVLTTERFSG